MTQVKRFIISALCMAAVALAVHSQPLPADQWRHGVALCAQMSAVNGGYGLPTDQLDKDFPNGFTLDDLNSVYSDCTGWKVVYAELKSQEAVPADGASLHRLAERTLKGSGPAVDSAVAAFAASAPRIMEEADTAGLQPRPSAAGEGSAMPLAFVAQILCLVVAVASALVAVAAVRQVRKLRLNVTEANARIEAIEQGLQSVAEEVQRMASRPVVGIPVAKTVAEAACRVGQAEAPRVAEDHSTPVSPQVFYMSRPDSNGCFMRASVTFEAGNSIFRLVTTDGQTATFEVIDDQNVHRIALMMPTENLTVACVGESIQLSHGKRRIVTDAPGEAVLECGKWHITRRATIHYE